MFVLFLSWRSATCGSTSQRGGLFRRVVAEIGPLMASLTVNTGQTRAGGESGCGNPYWPHHLACRSRAAAPSGLRVELSQLSRRQPLPWRRRMQAVFRIPTVAESTAYGNNDREPLDVHRAGTAAERQARVAELLDGWV